MIKFMFYLLKRKSETQCSVGDRVMVLADFHGIDAGQKGTITEIYDEGVMVKWDKGYAGFSNSDGFSRDELEYLVFETDKHPKILFPNWEANN